MSSVGGASGSAELPTSPSPLLTDQQLSVLSKDDLISRLRSREGECMRLMRDRAQLMKDVNRTLQLHLAEVRGLREVNQALQKDNQELRDLGCFLDDDRLKARKIAKEWQKFGKYTSTVMRQEVTAYQMKLYELEQKQESLLRENVELKELCLYLDDDREHRHGGATPAHVRVLPTDHLSHTPQNGSTLERNNKCLHSETASKSDPTTARQLITSKGDSARRNNPEKSSVGFNADESMGFAGEADGIDVDVSHASNSSTSSFSSNLDSTCSNLEMRINNTKK